MRAWFDSEFGAWTIRYRNAADEPVRLRPRHSAFLILEAV